MYENISLGKGRKAQQVDLAKMQQGGIIREAKNEKNESIFSDDEKKIFDAADKNGGKANGVLDKEELNKFLEDLKNAAGNGRLSKREANKFLEEHGLKDIDPKTLFSFVDKISQSSENISSCQMDTEGNIIIKYNDDKTETINSENQTSTIQSKDGKITEEYNAARELTKKTVKENETESTTTEYSGVDKDGNPIPTKETVISEKETEDPSKKEKTTTTTTFEKGKKKEIITSKDNGFSIITTLDENEKPKTEVETQGKYTEIHREYVDGNKNPRETKRFENKGLDTQKEYTYEYSKDGTEVKESISELGGKKNTVTIKKDKVLISQDITEPGKTTKVSQNKKGGYTEEITETIGDGENKKTINTTNELNSEMKRLSQTKQVGTKQYQLTYDGTGNTTGIIVQNGESPAAIAKKFGVPLDKLLEANADKLNGKKYFAVGEEIKIPREMEADEKVLRGRKDAQGAKAEYAQEQARIQAEREAARERRLAAQAAARQREEQYKELGLINHKGQGQTITGNYWNKNKIIKSEEFKIIGQCINGRTLVEQPRTGKLIVLSHNRVVLKEDYVKNPEKYEAARKYNEGVKTRKTAEGLAQQFYQIADDNAGLNSMRKMQTLLDTKINSKNIVAFLDAYDREKTRQGDSSIIDTVTSEVAAGGSPQQRKVLMTILNKLCDAAANSGVSKGDIQKAKKDFETSLNKEFAATFRRTNPKDMEKAIDFLRGAIAGKQTVNVESMDSKTAIRNFNSSFSEENTSAQSAYNDAKGKDGWSWSAKAGDTVCGWFGCNTIKEMEAKLGKNAQAVKALASAKTEAEFKTRYKQVFGIDFDPQKIAAADAAQSNYAIAQGMAQSSKIYNSLLANANSQNLAQFENSVRTSLKIDSKHFEELKKTVYSPNQSENEKKQALVKYLQNVKQELSTQYQKITKGKTIEQLGKDAQLVTKSAFGTNDIGKDVAQFTENMATTEMVSDIAGDIALTVALSMVPGGAAWGAARMAATAAKWGSKGLKIAKAMKRTAVVFNKLKKIEQGTKWAAQAKRGSYTAKALNVTTKTFASSANAALGTATYESTATHHTVEEIKEKCLTNGIYGALGAGSSTLAPKLMKAFNINNSLATEIAEEMINAAGSLGIEKAKGGEYGSKDATIDIISGILMARLSHIGSGKPHTKTTPKAEPQGVLEHATGNGSHQSGGKLNAEKMEAARQQVADVAQHGTPQEVAQVYIESGLQGSQSRSQGRELGQIVEDNAEFVSIGKERIALDSSDFDALARAKKEVSNWTDGTRNKEAILEKINNRMNEISAGQVHPTTPARGVDVVEHINDKVNQNAEHILDGNTGAIGSHDAATLRDQLANNLKSEGEIEQFIADIKQRVGVDEKGNMHVYQVQGKDHAADLVNAAEKKLKAIKANKANLQEASDILDRANAAGKGLSEDELKTLKTVAGKMTDPESLQTLIDKMKSNKKIKGHSGAKKAIGEMEAQVQKLKEAEAGHVQKAQTAEEPQGASDGSVANFEAEQRRLIAEGKLNPDGTPIEAQPKADSKETPAAHNADEPQEVPAANAKRAQNDIPELSQAEINKLKGSDLGIRQMPDGTIIKTDKNGKTSIIGKLYDKAMHAKRKIVAGFSSTEKLLNASNREAHVKLLASLKDTYGDTKFTKDEINKILDNLPKNIDVKGKDLLGLTSLPDVHVDEAISILQKIDNPEKLQVLRALTDTNDRVWALSHKLSKVPDNEINYYEIENILENLQDSKVSDLGTLFQDAISYRYNRCFQENNSLASFLNTMSDKIKTDEQKQALYTILDKIDTYDDDLQMYSSELFDDIIPLIKNSQDVEILQDAFDNVDRFSCAKTTFTIIAGNIDEGNKEFLSSVLRTARENNTRDTSYNVYDLISTLSYSRSNENVTNNMILNMAKNKVALTDISNLVSIPNSDSSHLIYERLNNGKFDYDVGALAEIKYDNDFQKQAFSILLDKNSGNRFEALAIKDIIENIKDESSINLLNKLLQNKNNGANTIIESLQNGRIIERPTGKLHSIVQNNDTMEQQILEILDIKNDTNSSITSYIDNLVKLNNASPKRFKKMLDSGLFDLIKEGKINASILENLDDNTFLSNRTLNDIRKIRNGEPIIKTLSSQTDLADISKYIANGDVCELNGKLYVNDNGTATQINLSKEKFEELFPPLTRVSFKQGQLGDCWFVSTLDNFMDLPNGRTSLYKLFEQQGDDILIKFPNSPNPIKFEGGEVLNAEGKQIQGFAQDEVPTGIRMIEQAYAIHRYYKYDVGVPVTEITSHATNVQGLMKELKGGWQYDAVNEILGDYNASIDSYGINLQNKIKMKEYIQQYANDENVLTFFATRDIPGGDTNMVSEKYDLAGRHAYSIKGYDKTTGMVYITNPWHTSVVTEIPLYELMKYIDDVNFAHFNKKEV